MSAAKPKVTVMGRLVRHYPGVLALAIVADLSWLLLTRSVVALVLLPTLLYLVPLLTHRIHNLFFPLKEGRWIIPSGEYPPWWGSFHIQMIYMNLPFLEAFLRLIPGAFSLWLRLWGSKIGQNVIWGPAVEIADRGLLEIGSYTTIAHGNVLISHVLSPSKDGRVLLLVKKIKIGNLVFVGAGTRMGPGTEIADRTKVDALSDFIVGQKAAPRPQSLESE